MSLRASRGSRGGAGVRPHLSRLPRSAAIVMLVLLGPGVMAQGQTLTFRDPADLLVGEPTAFINHLEAARPTPVSVKEMARILQALPRDGEVTKLDPLAQQKIDAIRQLLAAAGRDWYEIKVIDVPQATIALHARAVVLFSAPAIALLSGAELQGLAAHEIGHEYVWTEWNRARQQTDHQRLKELELVCDAIAAATLHRLGIRPSLMMEGVAKVTRFNRERFGAAVNEKNYPSLTERRAFARQIQLWLRDSH